MLCICGWQNILQVSTSGTQDYSVSSENLNKWLIWDYFNFENVLSTHLFVLCCQRNVNKEFFHPQPIKHCWNVCWMIIPLEAILSLISLGWLHGDVSENQIIFNIIATENMTRWTGRVSPNLCISTVSVCVTLVPGKQKNYCQILGGTFPDWLCDCRCSYNFVNSTQSTWWIILIFSLPNVLL